MSFKLLAIRPLDGCNTKFLKNLKENQIYQFYNDYDFYDEKQKKIEDFSSYVKVESLKSNSTIPPTLYDVKRKDGHEDLLVSISAIVGKNGSGKSSLIELLYISFYNLSVTEGIIKNRYRKAKIKEFRNKLGDTKEEKVIKLCLDEFLKYDFNNILFFGDYNKKVYQKTLINQNIYFTEIIEIIEKILIFIENNPFNKIEFPKEEYDKDVIQFRKSSFFQHITIFYENKLNNLIANNFLNFLKYSVKEIDFIEKDVFVEIYFEINKEFYLIVKDSNDKELKFRFYKLKDDKWDKIDFKDFFINETPHFFYNLVVNYSLYGLNSKETGLWVEKLFHKNDGYQTPIVINPYRDKGNIDINSENGLLRDRMMYNMIINESLRQVTPTNKVIKLVISRKSTQNLSVKVDLILASNEEYYDIFISNLILFFNSGSNIKFTKKSLISIKFIEHECLNYILKKLKRISQNYLIYNEFIFNQDNINDLSINNENIEKIIYLLQLLQVDRSHITNKLRQAINFIFINRIEEEKQETEKDEIYTFYGSQNYSRESNAEVQKISFKKFSKLIINRSSKYNIDIINLLPPSIFINDYKFQNKSDFSYLSSGERQQIFSLNSILYHLINLNSSYNNGFKFKYPYINLILDEIELYAHPDMQRKYVKELFYGISKLNIENIKGINVLFITHSPFILSDIPKQNVLFLEVEKLTKKAKPVDFEKMNTFGANIHDLLADSFFITDGLIGDFAKEKIQVTLEWLKKEANRVKNIFILSKNIELPTFVSREEEKAYHKLIIELIDEPLVKHKLKSMYLEFVDDDEYYKNEEIERLKAEIKKLESK